MVNNTMTSKIGISVFNKKTREQFMNSSKDRLGHKSRVNEFGAEDIILLNDIESQEVFGIVTLGVYDNGKIYRDHHLLDADLYEVDAARYNKYDIKIGSFRAVTISFNTLANLCGRDATSVSRTNIWKGTHLNYTNAFFKGDDSEIVLNKLHAIIKMLLTVQTL
jgi:hypothetical protein